MSEARVEAHIAPHDATACRLGWFRERGVELKTEGDGRMFPVTDKSVTIVKVPETERAMDA